MFESLKKKFTGTIGKITDKVAEEENLDSSDRNLVKAKEKSDSQDSADVKSDLTIEKTVEESQTESNTDVEILPKNQVSWDFYVENHKSVEVEES